VSGVDQYSAYAFPRTGSTRTVLPSSRGPSSDTPSGCSGAEDAFVLADVDRLLDPFRAIAGTEVDHLRQRRVDGDVALRTFHERRQVRVVACFRRGIDRFVYRRLQRLVVELARRRAARLRAEADVDRDLLIVLNEVGRDRDRGGGPEPVAIGD